MVELSEEEMKKRLEEMMKEVKEIIKCNPEDVA